MEFKQRAVYVRARVHRRRRVRRRRRLLLLGILVLVAAAATLAAAGLAGENGTERTGPERMLSGLTLPDTGAELEYGRSGMGRPLNAYRFGSGENTLLLTFAIHGYEDSFAADGAVLVYTAYQLMAALDQSAALLEASHWTVYVLPCLNPDGLYDGHTNDGPGRCTVVSLDASGAGVDMNRCFPAGWKAMTGARNFNGGAPLACVEAAALARLAEEVQGTGRSVCIDAHGWYQQTITSDGADGPLFALFHSRFPDNTWADCRNGEGYFTAYTAELGYDSCLFEFPGDVYSFEGFLEKGYAERFTACVLELLAGGAQGEER